MGVMLQQSERQWRRLSWRPFGIALFLTLSGCASLSGDRDSLMTARPVDGASERRILAATTRKRSDEGGAVFGIERAAGLDYASLAISVPPTHKPGEVETSHEPLGDPKTDFVIGNADYLSGDDAFLAQLNAELRRQPHGRRKILLFIHGFNTLFYEAAFRSAQIAHDAKLPIVPVVFSWASKGSVVNYGYDNNSALIARPQLARFLKLLQKSDADKIDIVAHSLGNLVLVEALIQMKLQGVKLDPSKIGFVVMASPDIDFDVFKSQLAQAGSQQAPYFVLISKDDQALSLSRLIAGGRPRLGALDDPKELATLGATVIDATDLKAQDPVNHDKYAQIAQIAPQLEQEFERSSSMDASRLADRFRSLPIGGAILQVYSGH